MTSEEFAWVRANVWTAGMRNIYAEMPGYHTTCACQYGLTTWCQHDDCRRCHRATPLPRPGGYVCDRNDRVLRFPEPYEHPTPSATGLRHTSLAMWWYADRVCRWVCPCPHHTARLPEQGALFDLAVSA